MEKSIIYNGEDGQRHNLLEIENLFVIRTNNKHPNLLFSKIKSIEEYLSKISLKDAFPESSVYVYECQNSNIRDAFKYFIREVKHPEIEYIGSVLAYSDSGIYQLYTGNLFIKFHDNLSESKINLFLLTKKLKIKSKLGFSKNSYFVTTQEEIGSNIFSFAEELLFSPEVAFAHPELVTRRKTIALSHADKKLFLPPVPTTWALEKIQVFNAWKHTRGQGIRIAIIDDGLEFNHKAFNTKNKIIGPRDMLDKTGTRLPMHQYEAERHGTACASIACSADPFAWGVAPDAQLIPIRSLGLGSVLEAEAFYWAVQQGADIISCSWGPPDGNPFSETDQPATYPIPDHTNLAIAYAARKGRQGKGSLIFFAAGNGNELVKFDKYASHPDVMAIGATNLQDKKAVYSDYGSPLFCCFPSGDYAISPNTQPQKLYGHTVADRLGDAGYAPGQDYYHLFDGTSAASPGAAGIAALVLSLAPGLTRSEATAILSASCEPLGKPHHGHDPNYGQGLLRADLAVRNTLNHLSFSTQSLSSMSTSVKRLSLHIGINKVGPAYNGKISELYGCIADMQAMRQLAVNQQFSPFVSLTDTTATRQGILDAIESLALRAEAGDFVLITYAGHGTQLKDQNGDETDDNYDEAWVAYDGFLLDDDLFAAFAKFRKDVRVLVVSDSCHSGTMNRNTGMTGANNGDGIARFVPVAVAEAALAETPALLWHHRGASDDVVCPARIKLLAACQDNQVAMESGGRGTFSVHLEAVFNAYPIPSMNYQTFLERISSRMSASQRPKLNDVGGQNPTFDSQHPFSDANALASPQTPQPTSSQETASTATSSPFRGVLAAAQDRFTVISGSEETNGWDQAYLQILTKPNWDFCEPDTISLSADKAETDQRSASGDTNHPEYLDTYPSPGNKYSQNRFIWHLDENHSQLRKALEGILGEDFPGIATGKKVNKDDITPKVTVTIAHIDTGYLPGHLLRPMNLDEGISNEFTHFGNSGAIDIPDQQSKILEQDGHGNATMAILAGNYLTYEQTDGEFEGYFGAFPFAHVISYRISDTVILNGGKYFALAVEDAIRQKVDVISMSMAGIPSPAMANAINKAYEAGIVVVTAAGNSFESDGPGSGALDHVKDYLLPEGVLYPARFERVVAVAGATFQGTPYVVEKNKNWKDKDQTRWAGGRLMQMSFGPRSAMKNAIAGYTPNITWFSEPGKNGKPVFVKTGGGTSSATPQIAAAAALYVQKYKKELSQYTEANAWKKAEIVRQALFRSAYKDPNQDWELYFGNGTLRAFDMLDAKYAPEKLVGSIKRAPQAHCSFLALKEIFNTYTSRSVGNPDTKAKLQTMLEAELLQQITINPRLHYLLAMEDGEITNSDLIKVVEELQRMSSTSELLRRSIGLPAGLRDVRAASGRNIDSPKNTTETGVAVTLAIQTVGISAEIVAVRQPQSTDTTINWLEDVFEINVDAMTRDANEAMLNLSVSHAENRQVALLIHYQQGDESYFQWQFTGTAVAVNSRDNDLYAAVLKPQLVFPVNIGHIATQTGRGINLSINPGKIIVKAVSWVKDKVIGTGADIVGQAAVNLTASAFTKPDEMFFYDLNTPSNNSWQAASSEILGKIIKEANEDGKPILLCFPGLFSTVHGGFKEFFESDDAIAELRKNHCGYAIGFNFPTLTRGIESNAMGVAAFLQQLPLNREKTCFNVIARSRGGIVARYLFEQLGDTLPAKLNRMYMTGTPNQGTPIADNTKWEKLATVVVNLLGRFIPAAEPLEAMVKELVVAIVDKTTQLPGMSDLEYNSPLLAKLNSALPAWTQEKYKVVCSDYRPNFKLKTLWKKALDIPVDAFFFSGVENDFVVPQGSALFQMQDQPGTGAITHKHTGYANVWHFAYLNPEDDSLVIVKDCITWLTTCQGPSAPPPPPPSAAETIAETTPIVDTEFFASDPTETQENKPTNKPKKG